MHAKLARQEFRRLTKTGSMNHMKPGATNIIECWNHDIFLRNKLTRAIRIASNITPKMAINSKVLSNLVKHSLKTELMKDVEANAYNMGLMINYQDIDFRDCIKMFQEPTEKFVPLSFTTTYKTTIYATLPECINPAILYDFEDEDGSTKRDTAVEFTFLIQNLTTAWPRKFDKLHDWSHEIPIKKVIPENFDRDKLIVKRSKSYWAKIIRNEPLFLNETENEQSWAGERNFKEARIETYGLRPRINAIEGMFHISTSD